MQPQQLENPTLPDLQHFVDKYFSSYKIKSFSHDNDLLEATAELYNGIEVIKLNLSVFRGLEIEKGFEKFGEFAYREQNDDGEDVNHQERKYLMQKVLTELGSRRPLSIDYAQRSIANYKAGMQKTEEFVAAWTKDLYDSKDADRR